MSPRERLFSLEHFGIKLGLDNVIALLAALHHPERAFRAIHVAGTNGKGSVTAMVERGLRAAGHRTGRYTSPHLAHIEERIVIDGQSVDAGTFDEVTADVLATIDRLQAEGSWQHSPTFFETTTAIAFEIFRRRQVAIAVVEVGLGGRYDATNVIDPIITAITSIALDHERHLGHTLPQIAFEKAGIIKAGVPVVVGPMAGEAADVIAQVAASRGAPVFTAAAPDLAAGTPVSLALAGAHQRTNAAIAVQVLRLCPAAGIAVAHDHIVSALTAVEWPARMEWLRLPSRQDVLIDAAHNPEGAAALAAYVIETTGALPLVLGVMKDKDVDEMIRAVAPAASRIVATQVGSPRALEARALADRAREIAPSLSIEWRAGADAALELALEQSARAMVAGSIFLIGPLRERLIARGAGPVRYPSKAGPFFLP
jgi:dihydrofolate synthase / folylpolyglutamate synthase